MFAAGWPGMVRPKTEEQANRDDASPISRPILWPLSATALRVIPPQIASRRGENRLAQSSISAQLRAYAEMALGACRTPFWR
jgi:hypothetical protein